MYENIYENFYGLGEPPETMPGSSKTARNNTRIFESLENPGFVSDGSPNP
jgi:hypothetical protein